MSIMGAIALWCKTNGTMPEEITTGADIGYPHEKGVEVANDGATAKDSKNSHRLRTKQLEP